MRIDGWFDFADAAFPLFVSFMLVASTAIVAAWLMSLGLKRRANLRHAVWLSALAVVLLGPGLVWIGGALRLPPIAPPRFAESASRPLTTVAEPSPRGEMSAAPAPEIAREDAPNTIQPESAKISATPARSWAQTARALAVAGWLLGSLALLVRLIHGCRRVAQLRRGARPLPSGVEAILPRVASALGVSVDRLPAIGVSPATNQPVTLGLVRPLVLIPDDLAERLSADELRDVLVHECAHALRRDAVVGLLQRLAAVACWPNPLIHLMNRALESAREELCDNHVLRASNPADYAASLLKVALSRPRGGELDALLGLPFIARRAALEDRVKALVDPLRNPSTAAPRVLTLGLAILFLVSSTAVAAIRFDDADQAPAGSKTRLEGRVVDSTGAPVAGALVRAATGRDAFRSTREAATGPDGRFTLGFDERPNVAALEALTADGSLQSKVEYWRPLDPLNPAEQFKLVLEPAQEIVVHVTDAQGEPVEGAVVGAGDGLPSESAIRTNERGEARLRIPASERGRGVVAFKSSVGLDYHEGSPAPGERVDLVLGGAITVKVRVVDSADQPVAGATVYPFAAMKEGKKSFASLDGCATARVATDQAGIAVFDFLPKDLSNAGFYTLVPFHDGKRPFFNPKEPDAVITARVARATPVTGRVLTADEQPAPGILIQADGDSPDLDETQAFARTAADGSYRLELPPNRTYTIGVVDERHAALTRQGLVPREGRPLKHIDFHLEEGTIVRGRVTNKATGEPVADRTVNFVERGGAVLEDPSRLSPYPKEATLTRWTRTDHDGRYLFRVAQGSYYSPKDLPPRLFPFEIIDQAEIVIDFAE